MAATIEVSLWDALAPILRESLDAYERAHEDGKPMLARAAFWHTAQEMTERLSAPATWDEPSVPEYRPPADLPEWKPDWHGMPRDDSPRLSPETAEMWRQLADMAEGEWSYAPC